MCSNYTKPYYNYYKSYKLIVNFLISTVLRHQNFTETNFIYAFINHIHDFLKGFYSIFLQYTTLEIQYTHIYIIIRFTYFIHKRNGTVPYLHFVEYPQVQEYNFLFLFFFIFTLTHYFKIISY